MLNPTHDPARRSWVESANRPEAAFPIQNLPYGVFSVGDGSRRVGVAIGEMILDLAVLEEAGLLPPAAGPRVFDQPDINAFMARGPQAWQAMRARIAGLLDAAGSPLRDDPALRGRAMVPQHAARMHLPIAVRGFTDFYASKDHATNVGSLFRDPKNALTANWLHIPIGYNGRASSVVVSGTDIRRPLGQIKPPEAEAPVLAACRRLDFELEIGAIVGVPSAMGTPVTTAQAYDMIFGYVLLNDWSARDIQQWEYVPLGPFQSKAFATTISPWVVTSEALEPFRVGTPPRVTPLLPYLAEATPNNFDIRLEVAMRPTGVAEETAISHTNFRHMYYSAAQQLTHHAIGGCPMNVGDLLGSGTISGPTPDSLGSLLEMTRNGAQPLTLHGGGRRGFIEDGDEIIMRGWCEGAGYRIGFGEARGRILPAPRG
ncbi:MAG: fumarylacetoacetase [Rhodospirillales bacterium]|nr:fumarylacetoacetase [Rhodospirillales bacterium]